MTGKFSEEASALPTPNGMAVKGTVGILLLRA
jgi:hypothetical protein